MNTLVGLLPAAVTPAVAGWSVGVLIAVLGSALVLLVFFGRSRTPTRPRRERMSPDQVVLIPPYGTLPQSSRAPVPAAEEAARAGELGSSPHPLGIIKSGSLAMKVGRPASIADLELDTAATDVGETCFDEARRPPRETRASADRA